MSVRSRRSKQAKMYQFYQRMSTPDRARDDTTNSPPAVNNLPPPTVARTPAAGSPGYRPAGTRSPPKTRAPKGLGTSEPGRKRKSPEDSSENGGYLKEADNKRNKTEEIEPSTPTQVSEEQQTRAPLASGGPITRSLSWSPETNLTAPPTAVSQPPQHRKLGQPRGSPKSSQENGGNLQATENKTVKSKENEPPTSTHMPEEQQSQGGVMFQLKVAMSGLSGVFEIRAPGEQPILDALQADTRLKKIKRKLPKIYLRPYGNPPPVKGIPNLGSPCSVIEDGSFEAKLQKGKDQSLNMYGKDELQFSERHKFYLDLKDTKNKWLTKKNPNKFDGPILIDCLPNDTLLKALYRDARINNDRLRKTKLTTQTGDVNVKLTDKCKRHQDKIFNCKVGYDLQVSEKDWEKACSVQNDRDGSCQTLSNGPDVATSGTKGGNGTPGTQAEVATSPASGVLELDPQIVKELQELVRRSQAQIDELFQRTKAEKSDMRWKKKLDAEVFRPSRQDYYNANQGTRVELMGKLYKSASSVGILVKLKNGRVLGTCFRVGSRFVLTNKHVSKVTGLSSTGSSSGNDVVVYFNYLRQPLKEGPENVSFKVQRIVHSSQENEDGKDELDYSVLELEVPNDELDKLPPGLGHKIEQTLQNTTVTIIGHPDGRPKEVDTSCPVVGSNHHITVYLKFHPERCADYAMAYNPNRDNYMSAFGHGSSGSPGFDDDGNVVVMHTCGYHWNEKTGSRTLVHQGVKMTAIKEDLKQHLDEDVWQDLFLPPTENMEVE